MRRLRVFVSRLTSFVSGARRDRELDAEIASHLEEAIAEHIQRGLSPEDARYAALRDFGRVTQIKEVYRDVRSFAWLDDLAQDLRHTSRTLRKNPAFTLVAILTLALGIGANTAIFTTLDAVVFKPLHVPAARELVTFYESAPHAVADVGGGTGRYLRFSHPRFERLQEALGSAGSLAASTRSSRFVLRLAGTSERQFVRAQLVSDNYFATLGIAAARGRVFSAVDLSERQPPVAVVSDGFWKRVLGGSDAAVGQVVSVNGVSVTVVGVGPPGFFGMWTDSEADMWLPLTLQPALRYANNSSSYGGFDNARPWRSQNTVAWLNLVARIPHRERPRVTAALQAVNQQQLGELDSTFADAQSRSEMLARSLVVEPFAQGFSGLRGRYADALFALSAMVALVLLVTCANIANLLLARAAAHGREMAIRVSLGASAGRLVRQCLTESLTLALLGGAAGVLAGEWASQFLAHQVLGTSNPLPHVFSPDTRVIAFTVTISLVTAAVFGLAPAVRARAAGRAMYAGMNQRQAIGQAPIAGMRWLVTGQLALSVAVVFVAVLLGRTLLNVMRIDPGFSADRLVTVSFDPVASGYRRDQVPALGARLVVAARTVSGVTSAAAASCGLLAGCSSSETFRIDGRAEDITLETDTVTSGYFATAGIAVIAGRDFTDRDTDRSMRVAIVNESAARHYFNGQNPIGRRLGGSEPGTEIIALVRDARTKTVHEPAVPTVYLPIVQRSTSLTDLEVRTAGDPRMSVSALRDALRRAEPELLIDDVSTLTTRLARDLNRERLVAFVAFSFGVLTLLLAALGLYGVLSYGVARRTKEIGVRMALGARRVEVLGLILRQGAQLTLTGLVVGMIMTAAGSRYVSGMLVGVTPLDPATFVLGSLVFALVTTLAAYVPARRATRVDPLVALKCD